MVYVDSDEKAGFFSAPSINRIQVVASLQPPHCLLVDEDLAYWSPETGPPTGTNLQKSHIRRHLTNLEACTTFECASLLVAKVVDTATAPD